MLRLRHLAQPVDGEQTLIISGLLGAERAVVVEGREAVGEFHGLWQNFRAWNSHRDETDTRALGERRRGQKHESRRQYEVQIPVLSQ